MKVLRIVVISVLMLLIACACERQESSQVEMGFFFGAWQEYYGPDYHVEGSRIWYIREDGISVRTYDWYSDTESEKFLNYSLEQNQGRHMVTLHFQEEPQTKDQSFCIIKLTDEEMIWQNVDSEGDTRHFVNSKFWMNHEK